MAPQNEIINRVANSTLVTFDLEEHYIPGDRLLIDLKDILFQGLILREKDLRDFVKEHNWQQYENKFVAITCSADAIIPTWAYMLLAVSVNSYAKKVVLGTLQQLNEKIFEEILEKIEWSKYQNAKVVVKGCSKIPVPESAYIEVVNKLKPYASSIMFGEACSTVPLYKRPKA
jgi:fructose-1-phosphate kinase PfkB-like protein